VSNYRPVSFLKIIFKNIWNSNAEKDFNTTHQL
jgi:hypothetical protein